MTTNNANTPNQKLTNEDMDYLSFNSYVSQKYKLHYVATPKVACTSLKWWFATLENVDFALFDTRKSGETEPDLIVHEYFRHVAPAVTGLDRLTLANILEAGDYFRFAVVRNPFKRIFSAWQSKVFLHVPMQIETFQDADFFKREINCAQDIALSFEGFLEHLRAKEWPLFLDHHWKTQTEVLLIGKIAYSAISKIEMAEELWRNIASRIEERGGHMPEMQRTNESLLPFSTSLITKRSAELIRELYADDFRNFGYSLELPQKQEPLDEAQIMMAIRASSMIRARHQRFAEIRSVLADETDALNRAKATLILADQTLAEQKTQLIALNTAITLSEANIGHLNQTVTDRDSQIAGLVQTVTDRDSQIAGLVQTVTDRDNQIAYLGQTVTDRDSQIAYLGQTVTDRDSQIAGFVQTVSDHDSEIVALRKTISALKSSTSWIVTRPLRFIGDSAMQLKSTLLDLLTPMRKDLIRIALRIQLLRWYFDLLRCPLFNRQWYLAKNPDVSHANINPLWHYLTNGWKENRQPGPEFDGEYYRTRYPDIAGLNQPTLLHYWKHGRFEGRHMNPTLDLEWLQGDIKTAKPATPKVAIQKASDFTRSQNTVFLSVIIPTYNRVKFLPGIIEAWRKVHLCTIDTYEIIFSDDGSSDGSVEYLESVKDLPLRVLRNAHGGASSARNAAIRAASGERLLIIGDDIFPDEDILNVHAELGRQMGSEVAILGTVDWHRDLKVNHLMHHITEIGNEQFSYNRLKHASFIDFRHFYTCNISIDRHLLLEERAIFDERFNEYGFEDIELGYRLALRGLKIFFTTQATGEHYHPYNLAGFCRRQTSAGRMAVVFKNIHPGVERILGITALSTRAGKSQKSSGQDALWQDRVDMLIRRCDEYEQLLSSLPNNASVGIRQCLSAIYSQLFRAMYEYGVLTKLDIYPNPLAIAMAFHFQDVWNKYWILLAQNINHPINLKTDEISNLAEIINTGSHIDFYDEATQRTAFDELLIIKSIAQSSHLVTNNKNKLRHLASRTLYYLINDPRYLAHRTKQAFLNIIRRNASIKQAVVTRHPVKSALPGLVFEVNQNNRESTIALFRLAFGNGVPIYERTHDNLLKPLLNDGKNSDVVPPSGAEATIFFWPKSLPTIPHSDHLLSAYISLVENGLSLAIISHSLSQDRIVTAGDWRDNMMFSGDVAAAIFSGTLHNMPFKGKVLRLLPAPIQAQETTLDELIGVPVIMDANGFFFSKLKGSTSAIHYKAPYLPARIKTKPVVFVFPIFLAVGGVERNTIEIMRQLRDQYDFVVITMERLRPEQGSLAAQAVEVAETVIEMSEVVCHADYLRLLSRLKANLKPDLVWVCNGSPWFCDNAGSIRQIFSDVPIIDQEAYDTDQGWITRFNETGIQSFDHFIAVNKKIRSRFERDFGIGADRNTLIYSAIDTPRILNFKHSQPDARILREKLGLPQDKKIFTFIARLTAQKRPLLFLSLARSRLSNADECYVLVGDGELAPQALDYIKRHSLTNVIRIPYIENTLELNEISDGIIFTSAYEGLPIAMLEALSMGVPAFSTDVGDIADVLSEYGGGEVVSPTCTDDQLIEGFKAWLLHRSEYVGNLKSHEPEILDRFSSRNIAAQYVSCWQHVIANYSPVEA